MNKDCHHLRPRHARRGIVPRDIPLLFFQVVSRKGCATPITSEICREWPATIPEEFGCTEYETGYHRSQRLSQATP
jgi:hypothetical protein